MKFQESNFALDISKKSFTQVQVEDKQAISQSIESILMTDLKERVFNPEFGSFLNRQIFKSLDEDTGEIVLDKVINLIKRWEKRIYILEDQCTMNINRDAKILSLNIVYRLLKDGSFGQFNKKIIF